jgi:hypothetical protein
MLLPEGSQRHKIPFLRPWLAYLGEPVFFIFRLLEKLNNQGAQNCSCICHLVVSKVAVEESDRLWLCFTALLDFVDNGGTAYLKIDLSCLKTFRVRTHARIVFPCPAVVSVSVLQSMTNVIKLTLPIQP